MGKVKIRVVGDETAEQEQKEEQKKRREEKKKAQVKGVGLGGGQRINTVGISEEEIAKELETGATDVSKKEKLSEAKSASGGTKKARYAKARARSKRHTENIALATGQSAVSGKKTLYPIPAGIELLRKFKKSNFDETVELHINTQDMGIAGTVTLPHGTGKKLRIAVVNDELIAQIEKGKIDFDVLVATPDMMPKLAKFARILGPRGLMPNPKNGTISEKPETVVEKLSAGQTLYKTETQAPIIHMSVGKLSFKNEQLLENISTVLESIGPTRIAVVTLKSTMSPAVRLQV